jgi:hypothetical protein
MRKLLPPASSPAPQLPNPRNLQFPIATNIILKVSRGACLTYLEWAAILQFIEPSIFCPSEPSTRGPCSQRRAAHHLPEPGGDDPRRSSRGDGTTCSGTRASSAQPRPASYWLALILMDIRALGLAGGRHFAQARGNVASGLRASQSSPGLFPGRRGKGARVA